MPATGVGLRAGLGRRIAVLLAAHPLWWAFVAYGLLAVALTDPLARRLGSVIPADPVDPALNTWIVWWNAQAVPLTAAWWNAPIFFPSPGSLSLSEHLLGIAFLTTPIQWLGGGPQLAYNTALLLSFPLCAVAAHALCFELTRRHDAALLGGLVFGFAPFRIPHLCHIQVLSAYWMPVALLALHRYGRTRERRWLVLFAASWWLQALCSGYYLFYFSILVVLWLGWFLSSRAARPALRRVLVAWGLAAITLAPLLAWYWSSHRALGLYRSLGEVQHFSADLTSFLDASPWMAFATPREDHRPEGELFPGRTAPFLILLVVAVWLRGRGLRVTPPARWRLAMLVLAASFAAVAATPALFGPWRLSLNGIRLLSVSVSHKPLRLAFLSLTVFALGSPALAAACRRQSRLSFYLLATGVLALLCLGPTVYAFGKPVWYSAPYSWLMVLPGFSSLRASPRFAMPAMLTLGVAASLGFARLVPAGGRRAVLLAALCACGIVADGWIRQMPLSVPPRRSALLEQQPTRTIPVLELPVQGVEGDAAAMYRAMFHGRPLVNGYSGYFPPHYLPLRLGLARRDPAVLTALATRGPLDLRVDETSEEGRSWSKLLSGRSDVARLVSGPGESLFQVASAPPPENVGCGQRVAVRSVAAVPNQDLARHAHDGDLGTRWPSWPQSGNEEVTIELRSVTPVESVVLCLGRFTGDFPRELVVETALSAGEWTEAWRGVTAAPAVLAALDQPTRVPLAVTLGSRTARFIRLRQIGSDPVHFFSIAELMVCAPAATPPS